MKLIWKSADLSSALPDLDSCMEMRSQNRCTLFAREHRGIVIFPRCENEELGLDVQSLRGWKFNLEMAHILKPTIIGILRSVF